MRMLSIWLTVCCMATVCCAEWEIDSVSAKSFGTGAFGGKTELLLKIVLRNVSDKSMYLPTLDEDETGTVAVSAALFVRNQIESVWKLEGGARLGGGERANWKRIAVGGRVRYSKILPANREGRQMLAVFRCSGSKYDKEGREMLVGPFTVPAAR